MHSILWLLSYYTVHFSGTILRLRDTRARRVKCFGKCILNFANQNLWYEEREQLDSGGGGALSQGAGHGGSFFDSIILG